MSSHRVFMVRGGWFKLWRRAFSHDIWLRWPDSWFRVFVALIGSASRNEQTIFIGKTPVILPPGSLTLGTEEFSHFCRVTRQQCRDALQHLAQHQVITTRSYTKFTAVSITNWDTYQGEESDGNQQDNQQKNQRENQHKNQVDNHTTRSREVENTLPGSLDAPGKPKKPAEADPELFSIAKQIYDRHPHQRRCSVSIAVSQLRAIIRRHPDVDRSKLLSTVNANHAANCASHDWQKDGCKYAKGLENWLAPTKDRYLVELTPPRPSAPPQAYRM